MLIKYEPNQSPTPKIKVQNVDDYLFQNLKPLSLGDRIRRQSIKLSQKGYSVNKESNLVELTETEPHQMDRGNLTFTHKNYDDDESEYDGKSNRWRIHALSQRSQKRQKDFETSLSEEREEFCVK